MTRLKQFWLVAIVGMLILVASPVTAQTVTFGGIGGANGSAFTGPYSEAGYTVSVLGGQFCAGQIFGNPVASLFTGTGGGGACNQNAGTLSVTRTGGGLFNFLSADIAANNGSAPFNFTGIVGGGTTYVVVGSQAAQNPFGFTTVANPASGFAVDELRITLTANGTSANIDNLVFASVVGVPEPGSMLLFASGFFGLVGVRRRRETLAA